MKKENRMKWLRLFLFLLVCVAAVALCNTFCIQTDTLCALNLAEMHTRHDVQLALVGSSIVRDHFNNEIISEETGLTSFSVAIPSASLPANIASTKELFETNDPEWVVLVTEPYGFTTAKEDTETAYRFIPYIKNPKTLWEYYFRVCKLDGYYIDRLLIFREFGTETFDQVAKTFGMRFFPETTYEKLLPTLQENGVYQGAGFVRHRSDITATDLIRQTMLPDENSEYRGMPDSMYKLLPESRKMLLEYRDLVAEKGAKLLVVMYPNMTAHALNEPEFLPYNDCIMRFCQDNDIPCYNFMYARPEFLPRLDSYYYDLYHMNGDGADILSHAFAEFFNRYAAGEDVSDLFFENRWQYLDSLDFITNVWMKPTENGGFEAQCNHAPGLPVEYSFVIKNADGTETLLQPFGEASTLSAPVTLEKGCDLRVYARPAGQENPETVYYDWPTDYEAYLRD